MNAMVTTTGRWTRQRIALGALVLLIAATPEPAAAQGESIAAALHRSDWPLLMLMRPCAPARARNESLRDVAEWFRQFRRFRMPVPGGPGGRATGAFPGPAEIAQVRQLADERTVQGLMGLVDAEIGRHIHPRSSCAGIAARLAMLMAAQRDWALAWAHGVEEIAATRRLRRDSSVAARRFEESMQRLERDYRALNPYISRPQ